MYWNRRSHGRVAVYGRRDGRSFALPRDLCRHLDTQPDDIVDTWVKDYARLHEARKEETGLVLDDTTAAYLEGFIAYQRNFRLKNNATLLRFRRSLTGHVLPFFLQVEPVLPDPNQWPGKSARLLEHLMAKGLSQTEIVKANGALTALWEWLADEGVVSNGVAIRLRRPTVRANPTPLKYTLRPHDVLTFASHHPDREVALMALCGFFFSLRPQELFALTRRDFVAGSRATDLECCKVMGRHRLYDRLAVNISKQRGAHNRGGAEPKSGSKGWVACFDRTAAERLVTLLKQLVPKDAEDTPALLVGSPEHLIRKWEAAVSRTALTGTHLKDLRRASMHWLGHNTDLGVIALRSHARHKKTETTELYLRRPKELLDEQGPLDLDV